MILLTNRRLKHVDKCLDLDHQFKEKKFVTIQQSIAISFNIPSIILI